MSRESFASMPSGDVPAGYLPRAVLYWTGFHLRRNLRKRSFKLWAVAFVLGILAAQFAARVNPETLARAVVLGIVPFMALFFGAGSLREEIEDQTLTYAFTRPVGRTWTYVARVLANGLPVAMLAAPAGVWIGWEIGETTAVRYGLAALLGAVAYGSFFALVGQLIKWPAFFGLGWLLFWEGGVGTVPGFLGRLALVTHTRAVAGLPVTRDEAPWSTLWDAPPVLVSVVVLLGVTAGVLWLGAWRARAREFVITR
ncbi:MAG: hypothetical protein H6701_14425 [Myxococcales bacterium]|nr:hypothetical protein [Myxococcales bacterium]